jgi:hypothetical protein
MVPSMRIRARRIISAGLLVVALAACGGGGSDEDGVATLDDGTAGSDDGGTTDDDDAGGGRGGLGEMSPEFEDAMLEFAECMRDQGMDFPDPQSDGGGLVIMGGGAGAGEGPPSEVDMEEFEAADEACRHILEAVEGEMPRPDPEQEAEMRDAALAFSECMREHGVDFPDPQFDENGGMSMQIGDPEERGIDPSDPDFQEAQEECGQEGGPGFRVGTSGPDEGPQVESRDESNEDESNEAEG